MTVAAWRALRIALALLALDAAFTFHNVWPTLLVRWPGELSVEIAALVLLLALFCAARARSRDTVPPAVLWTLAVFVVLAALGRYAEVTAPALFGREINLYWDARHLAGVAAMLAQDAPRRLPLAIGAALAGFGLLLLLAAWSLREVALGMQQHRAVRRGLGAAAAALLLAFAAQRLHEAVPRVPRFSTPVVHTYARQLAHVARAVAGERLADLPASPAWNDSVAALEGADVLVVFVESYGSVTLDSPPLAARLQPARERLAAAADATGRWMLSARVRSPTFGGSSWFAHLTLLSGIDVRDPRRYELLMTQRRPTLLSQLERHGYRSVALMPGVRKRWPEGAFYGYDALYDAEGLDYRGPDFGWWRIPDQFALARLQASELFEAQPAGTARAPRVVVFPTINAHLPFRPVPPVQEDWTRMLGPSPYEPALLHGARGPAGGLDDMAGNYAAAIDYTLRMLASFLEQRGSDPMVVIVLGDHQPPALVSGRAASWDVPVHVLASQPAILDALRSRGFVAGATPDVAPIGGMHELGPMLLAAFAGRIARGPHAGE